MFREIIFLCVAALLANQALTQKVTLFGGNCPNVGSTVAVDLALYNAQPWYYLKSVKNFLEEGNRCSKQTITDLGGGILTYKVDVTRSSPATASQLVALVLLNAPTNPTAGLEFVHALYAPQSAIPFVPIYYKVLAVDYAKYSVVYSCQQVIPYILYYELGWIITRTAGDTSDIATINAAITAHNVDPAIYEDEILTDCATYP